MKNIVLLIVFLSTTFTLSATVKPSHEIQKVFLKALNDNHLNEVFKRDECSEYYPFLLVTNELLDDKTISLLEKNFIGTASSLSDVKSLADVEVLELSSLSIGKNKSTLDFNYDGKKLRIRLQKKGNDWKVYSVKVSGKGIFSFYYDA